MIALAGILISHSYGIHSTHKVWCMLVCVLTLNASTAHSQSPGVTLARRLAGILVACQVPIGTAH